MLNRDYLVIVQARMESSRLPGKVLMPILGQSMILHQLDRLRNLVRKDCLIVAVPDTPLNCKELAPVITRHGYQCRVVEGDPDDVLSRFMIVMKEFKYVDRIIRLTGDCPLIDPEVIREGVELQEKTFSDYVAMAKEWPDGLDFEVIRHHCIERADRGADDPKDREHVTPYIWRDRSLRQALLPCPFDLSRHKWSVDTEDDLWMARGMYREMASKDKSNFGWRDVLSVLSTSHELGVARYREKLSGGILVRNSAYADDWDKVRYGCDR